MAQNITLLGASYSAVPAVTLPKTGGGTARFDDASVTTATAADVAQGKIFLASDGTPTEGTGSGGGGGGASNLITGTFTTPAATTGATDISLNYTGTGYPIAVQVYVEGGAYNTAISDWYTSKQRYAIGAWSMSKSVGTTPPTYSGATLQNQGVTQCLYKNSTSYATTYSRTSAMTSNVYLNQPAASDTGSCVVVRSAKKLSYYTSTAGYGLLPGITYRYVILYSS